MVTQHATGCSYGVGPKFFLKQTIKAFQWYPVFEIWTSRSIFFFIIQKTRKKQSHFPRQNHDFWLSFFFYIRLFTCSHQQPIRARAHKPDSRGPPHASTSSEMGKLRIFRTLHHLVTSCWTNPNAGSLRCRDVRRPAPHLNF